MRSKVILGSGLVAGLTAAAALIIAAQPAAALSNGGFENGNLAG